MAEHTVHEQSNNGTHTLLAVLLIIAIILLGIFLFRNGIGGIIPSRSTNIEVQLPGGQETQGSGNTQ